MAYVYVNPNTCISCGDCDDILANYAACPNGLNHITLQQSGSLTRCIECQECVNQGILGVCPTNAISLQEKEPVPPAPTPTESILHPPLYLSDGVGVIAGGYEAGTSVSLQKISRNGGREPILIGARYKPQNSPKLTQLTEADRAALNWGIKSIGYAPYSAFVSGTVRNYSAWRHDAPSGSNPIRMSDWYGYNANAWTGSAADIVGGIFYGGYGSTDIYSGYWVKFELYHRTGSDALPDANSRLYLEDLHTDDVYHSLGNCYPGAVLVNPNGHVWCGMYANTLIRNWRNVSYDKFYIYPNSADSASGIQPQDWIFGTWKAWPVVFPAAVASTLSVPGFWHDVTNKPTAREVIPIGRSCYGGGPHVTSIYINH